MTFSRFIINSPDDFSNSERLFFQLELALWFYMDNYQFKIDGIPRFSSHGSKDFVEFVRQIYQHLDLDFSESETKQNYKKFATYKKSVPVCGALILNSTLDKILLIKAFESELWGLPKGKINSGETDVECAIREVNEEVGYDITDAINVDNFVEERKNKQNMKFFVIPYVDEKTRFTPKSKNEVEFIKWVTIDQISADYQFLYVVELYDKIKAKIAELKKKKKEIKSPVIKKVTSPVSLPKIPVTTPVKITPQQLFYGVSPSPPMKPHSLPPQNTYHLDDLLMTSSLHTSTPSPKKKKLKEFF